MAGKSKTKSNETKDVKECLEMLQNPENQIKKLYVLYGEETFRRDSAVRILKNRLISPGMESVNLVRLDGKETELQVLEDAVNRPPMMADRSLIMVTDSPLFRKKRSSKKEEEKSGADDIRTVDNSNSTENTPQNDPMDGAEDPKSVEGWDMEKLFMLLSDLPAYVCLVFLYDTVECIPDTRTKLYKKVKDIGEIVEFTPASPEELEPWIRSRCEEKGVSIERAEIRELLEYCGTSMQVLTGELDKLCLYTNNGRITREDIHKVTCGTVEGKVFSIYDAIVLHRPGEALRRLRELEQIRQESIPLLSILSGQLRKLYTARLGLERQLSQEEINELCGLKPPSTDGRSINYPEQKLMQQARGVSLSGARQALLLITAYDWPLKVNRDQGYDLFNDLVLALCRTLEKRKRV